MFVSKAGTYLIGAPCHAPHNFLAPLANIRPIQESGQRQTSLPFEATVAVPKAKKFNNVDTRGSTNDHGSEHTIDGQSYPGEVILKPLTI